MKVQPNPKDLENPILPEFEQEALRRLTGLQRLEATNDDLYSGVKRFKTTDGWTFDVFIDAGEWDYFDRIEDPEGNTRSYGEFSQAFSRWKPYLKEEEEIWGLPGHCRKFEEEPVVEHFSLTIPYDPMHRPEDEPPIPLVEYEGEGEIDGVATEAARRIVERIPSIVSNFPDRHSVRVQSQPMYRRKDVGRAIIREMKNLCKADSGFYADAYADQIQNTAVRLSGSLSAALLFYRPYLESFILIT